jgi:hypothetical protein
MAQEHPRLKLGKGSAFVKRNLKQWPQEKETWEADFRALPKQQGQTETHYLGLVVTQPKGDPLVYLPVEYNPNVNDLADLLASAMRRPMMGSPRRPEQIHFRDNPRWEELYRHLNDLGVETSIHEELPKVEEVYEDFCRQVRQSSPGRIIMLSRGKTSVEESYPAIAQWVNDSYGHIEIGDQEGFGFIARALDHGGLAFEDKKPRTLAESMAALEKGLAKWFRDKETDL